MLLSKAFLAGSFAAVAHAGVVPTVKIAPGVYLPMSGLGTWQYNTTTAQAASELALDLGYTHIDTALGYGNQVGVGNAIKNSGRARDSLFVTSKIPGGLNFAEATRQLELSLSQLGLDYVDLMLTHFPASWSGVGGKEMRVQEWKALEAFQKAGKAKAIGVSHYCRQHVQDILDIPNTVPIAVNQVQYHVGMGLSVPNATDDKTWMTAHGILYQSFSPLCGPCGTKELIDGPMVVDIGKKYNKSGAQVSLRWLVQSGVPVIPKTDKSGHLVENIDLFDWELSQEDMDTLNKATSPPVAGNSPTDSGDCGVP
jgi:diketogulonate reductase-like aldo/keto reductase